MMSPLWLDYLRPPPGRHRAGVLLLAVGVVATAGLVALYVSVTAARDELQIEVARLERQSAHQQALEQAGAAAAGPGERLAAAAPSPSVARWESLFAALERASDDNVTLLDLEPRAAEVRLVGEAKDLTATLDYVKRLQGAPALADAHLTEYETVFENPYRPVRFALAAAWREAL